MKLLSTLLLSLVVFMAGFQNSLMWIDYEVNRNFYEIHCVNKDKPEMECHGKCEMKKEADKNPTSLELVSLGFEFNLHQPKNISIPTLKKTPFKNLEKKIIHTNNLALFCGYQKILPHPPQF